MRYKRQSSVSLELTAAFEDSTTHLSASKDDSHVNDRLNLVPSCLIHSLTHSHTS